ncbi:MAG: response regulator [Bacteroidota bacterium]
MAEKMTKIVIADDHELIRHGLVQVLEKEFAVSIMETDNGKEALELIKSESPDVAILDIEMPEMTGYEVGKAVHKEGLGVDIVFLTMHDDETMFNRAMDIGAMGYMLKENTITEIVSCLNMVKQGKPYISPNISNYLLHRNQRKNGATEEDDKFDLLTESERNILKLVAEMYTSQEIADKLHVSLKTVQNHRSNMCKKLGLSGTHALLKYAVERKNRI